MSKGIGGHHRAYKGRTDEWLTPPDLLKSMGYFDLDPCAPVNPPWTTADFMYNVNSDGLKRSWHGRVWLNPPYGPETHLWLQKMADHNNGIALIFARTETKMFFDHVWSKASALLFINGRLFFYDISGKRAPNNSGGPSVLVAYDPQGSRFNSDVLMRCPHGKFVDLKISVKKLDA